MGICNMITFEHDKLSVKIVRLKSITQALGGSISVLDDERTVGIKEVYKRIPVPLAVARAFIMKHAKMTKYLKPVYTALIEYDGHIIAMERHPMGMMGELTHTGFDGQEETWIPYSESNLYKFVYPLMTNSGREWFFDGRYAFSFEKQKLDDVVAEAIPMTEDGRFRKISTMAIDLQELANADKLQPQERSCVTFVTNTGEYSISPPIWKDIESMGASRSASVDDGESTKLPMSFDRMDEIMSVNINFALKAGKEIGAMFGYEYVDPLQLPRLMIELHTVNLPNIPKQVKATYCIGMKFTHAFAWLLGISRRANTLETYIMMRSLMKYLSKRGIYRSGVFKADQIFVDGKTSDDVPLLDLDELLEDQDFTAMSIHAIIEQAKSSQTKRTKNSVINNLAGLQTEA